MVAFVKVYDGPASRYSAASLFGRRREKTISRRDGDGLACDGVGTRVIAFAMPETRPAESVAIPPE
jgi:hypothetical protein